MYSIVWLGFSLCLFFYALLQGHITGIGINVDIGFFLRQTDGA